MIQTMELDTYISDLRRHLAPIAIGEREEILREITAHVRDSVEQSGSSLAVVLQRLGPAEALAAQYRDGLLIRRASHSISPLLLLHASLRLATKGISGMVVCFAAIFGYLIGGGFVLSAFAKCIFPAHTGVWFSDGKLISSGTLFEIPQPPAHEVAGWWYVPVALVLGSVLILLTSFVVRTTLRISRLVRENLDIHASAATAR
jgi:uncharacterized membrane protein